MTNKREAQVATVQLGDLVRDQISGFEGVAFGICYYMYGCVKVCVSPKGLRPDGDPIGSSWFDEGQLEIVQELAVDPPATAARAGGPVNSLPPR